MTTRSTPSRSRLDKAGVRLRSQELNPTILDIHAEEVREDDIQVVNTHRQAYADPLLKVRMGLTSFRATIGSPDAPISQRTKRFDRIIRKMARFPTQRLSQMQDVGGVRVILNDLDHADGMVDRILTIWGEQVQRHDDYVSVPQPSGYRAHHVVVVRDGRAIEIQIRTENQHTWAENVESSGRLIGFELKWGQGPNDVLQYYQLLGEVVEVADRSERVPQKLLDRTNAAHDAAQRRMLSIIQGGIADG